MYGFKEFITERTYDIHHEVDFIYNRFFKEFIDDFQAAINEPSEYIFPRLPDTFGTIRGNELLNYTKNALMKKAYELNPLMGIYTDSNDGNVYRPSKGYSDAYINLSLNKQAIGLFREYGGNINLLSIDKTQLRFLRNEVTEARVKGTINHEISHWLNDSLHGKHITKRINRSSGMGSEDSLRVMNKGKNRTHQFLTDYELDAQIQAIIEYRRKNPGAWKRLTLEDALSFMPFYFAISTTLNRNEMKEWKRYIYTRLAREDLLGKKMKRARSLSEASCDYITHEVKHVKGIGY